MDSGFGGVRDRLGSDRGIRVATLPPSHDRCRGSEGNLENGFIATEISNAEREFDNDGLADSVTPERVHLIPTARRWAVRKPPTAFIHHILTLDTRSGSRGICPKRGVFGADLLGDRKFRVFGDLLRVPPLTSPPQQMLAASRTQARQFGADTAFFECPGQPQTPRILPDRSWTRPGGCEIAVCSSSRGYSFNRCCNDADDRKDSVDPEKTRLPQ